MPRSVFCFLFMKCHCNYCIASNGVFRGFVCACVWVCISFPFRLHQCFICRYLGANLYVLDAYWCISILVRIFAFCWSIACRIDLTFGINISFVFYNPLISPFISILALVDNRRYARQILGLGSESV